MTRRAVGYIRQSARRDEDTALSEATQRKEIIRLAAFDGFAENEITFYVDLGKSGGAGKERLRPKYQEALAEIDAGRVTHLYALSLTRIARSTVELYRVGDLCKVHNVAITTAKEGRHEPNGIGKALWGMMAVFSELERDMAVDRALDNHAERRRRGEKWGKPYEDRDGNRADEIVRLFRETRSLNGTATRLNDAGIPSSQGRKWVANSVRKVIERLAPDLLPTRAAKGVRPAGEYRLFRLLKCGHCGQILTGRTDHRYAVKTVNYRCYKADADRSHPRTYCREDVAIAFIKSELALLGPKPENAGQFARDETRLARLQANLVRLREEYLDPDAVEPLAKDDYEARKADLQDRIANIKSAVRARTVPDGAAMLRDWDDTSAETINRFLRDAFRWIELDRQAKPVRAEWTVPEWRLSVVPEAAASA